MPAPILHLGATVLCSHAGTAQPTMPNPRITVSGQAVVTVGTPYVIAGCALSGSSTPPCTTGQFLTGSTRVLAGGVPLAVMSGSSTCLPTAAPMLPVVAQLRVVAT